MAKTSIEGVQKGPDGYIVHVVVKGTEETAEGPVDIIHGEGFVKMPANLGRDEMRDLIEKAADGVMDDYNRAASLRETLQEEEWPEPGARRTQEPE